jgi:flagellar hook-basal body complex protein FliE
MNSIQTTTTSAAPLQPPPLKGGAANVDGGASFKDFLIKSIQDVNSAQAEANQAVETLMTGGDVDPASVLTAVEKADLAFRMMLQMRNKVLQVYQEVRDIRI